MANPISEVKPGELITADRLNEIIDRLNGLGEITGLPVPNLFGLTLAQAKSFLRGASSAFQVGTVLDIHGVNITDGNDAARKSARVLAQNPSPGDRAMAGAAINFVIAAPSSGTDPSPSPGEPPAIGEFSKNPINAGEILNIFGTNFASDPAGNSVALGTKVVPALAGSDTRHLVVQVPLGVETQPQPITVVVTSGGRGSVGRNLTVSPPGAPPPSIERLSTGSTKPSPDDAHPITITVTGDNFGNELGVIRVFFGDTASAPFKQPSAINGRILTVPIPIQSAFPALRQSGDSTSFLLVVTVNGVASLPSPTELTVFIT